MADDAITFRFSIDVFPAAALLRDIETLASPVIRRTSDQLKDLAASKVGRRYSGTNNNKDGRTSRLAQSGKVVQGSGLGWSVIFEHPAAAAHHNGVSDHGYDPGFYRNKNPNTWTKSPYRDNHFQVMSLTGFTHPGNAANPFTLDAARELGLRSSGALRRGTAGPFPVVRAGPGFF